MSLTHKSETGFSSLLRNLPSRPERRMSIERARLAPQIKFDQVLEYDVHEQGITNVNDRRVTEMQPGENDSYQHVEGELAS